MKIGVSIVNAGDLVDADSAIELARQAEDVGIESLWAVEHVVVPYGYRAQYPYSASGKMPSPEDLPTSDPLVWFAFIAAATSRIRLATGVVVLPYRHPVVLAKQVASLDRLSGGRFLLGVGIGWLKDEFDALGIPWGERVDRLEESVAAMRCLWRDDVASFDGHFA